MKNPPQTDEQPELPQRTESWWRTQSATIALLAQAYQQIEEAEERIRVLEALVTTDALTGLANRRGLENFFTRECARARRHGVREGMIALADLDRFKAINDTYGHAAGDACLKIAAEALLKTVRASDIAARIGGDEFALVLTHTNPARIGARLDNIRSRLNRLHIDWEGRRIYFSASLGVAPFVTTDSLESAFHAADASLYEEKKKKSEAKGKE